MKKKRTSRKDLLRLLAQADYVLFCILKFMDRQDFQKAEELRSLIRESVDEWLGQKKR